MEFIQKLEKLWKQGNFVSIGLDPEYSLIPEVCKQNSSAISDHIFTFNSAIIDATREFVCAYKPNSAFYEAHGAEGWDALAKTIAYIKTNYPEIPVILDAKRADIGNTNKGYVTGFFDVLHVDAVTVHAYLGQEALEPFLSRKDKGTIVLVKTSNPGSGEFQNLEVSEGKKLYQIVAEQVASTWNKNKNCCVVVGATYPEELAEVRQIIGDMPILIPGIGAQGGDVEATVNAGKTENSDGIIVHSGRSIIYASSGPDFAEAARIEAKKLNEQIKKFLV